MESIRVIWGMTAGLCLIGVVAGGIAAVLPLMLAGFMFMIGKDD